MDPTVEKLMAEFGMSQELAEQTAANLSRDGTARKAPKAKTTAPPSVDPAPIQYKAGPGKSGFTRDETVRVLVSKHGVPPEQAVAHAQDLRKHDPEGVQNEAVGDVAMREVRRLNLMKRYEDIIRAQEAGEEVDPVDARWAATVTNRAQQLRTQRIQQSAGESAARREQAVPPDPRVERKAATMRSFRPGMVLGPDQQSLLIPVRQPNPRTVTGLMNSFGMDQGSATQLAMQFEGE